MSVIILFGVKNAESQIFNISSSNPAVSDGIIIQGETKQIIYRAVVQVTGSGGANFTNLTFTPTGTFVASDINTTYNNFGYCVWAGTTDNIAAAVSISNLFPPQTTGNPVSITINSPYWTSGNTYYLWITADISPTAIAGHTLMVGALSLSDFTFNRGTKAGSLYGGGTQKIGWQSIFTSNGTFTVPEGVTSITVQAWGGGGAGGAGYLQGQTRRSGGGGGGGAYAIRSNIGVAPSQTYTVTIGSGGTTSTPNGGISSSTFGAVTITALGGSSGGAATSGGQGTNGSGGVGGTAGTFSGGNGANGADGYGGGGGSSAGTNSNGNNATGQTGGAAVTNGGAGGNGNSIDGGNGLPGSIPGGGGGGGRGYNSKGGSGGNGQIIISWTTDCTPPLIPTASNNGPICAGSTVNLTASAVSGATYAWTGPNGFTSILQNPTIANATIAASGIYSVTATVNGCTSAAGTTNVTVNPNAAVSSVTGSSTLCIGSTANYMVNGVVLSGGTGTWSSDNTSVATVDGAGNVTALSAGTCNIKYTITGGCGGTVSVSKSVTVNVLPSPPTTTGGQICIGSTAILSASGAVSGQVYKWYDAVSGGNLLKTSTSNTDDTYTTPVISATTSYWVSILSASGCESSRSQVSATFPIVSSDAKTVYGSDTWIGYVYKRADAAAQAPTDANAYASYYGKISEQKLFNEAFGGATVCLPLTATESPRSIYTEYFAVKFLMSSSDVSGIYLADIGSDDGSRLTVDGNLVYNQWIERGYSADSKVLFQLNGGSKLLLEYYDSSVDNRISFQNLSKVPNALVSGKTQIVCTGDILTQINANNSLTDAPISNTAGFTVSYLWQQASALGGPWIDIVSATSMSYIPTGLSSGTYYFRRKLTISKTNPGMGSATIGTDYSDVATIIITSSNTVSTASSAPMLCINTALTDIKHTTSGATGIGTATGLPAGVSASWAPNTITISGTPTVSGTFNYSVPLTGGCGSVNATGTITVIENPTVANAGPDQTGESTCGLTTVTLGGNTPTIGAGAWTIVSGNGGTIATPSSPTSTFSGIAGSTYTLRWTISNSPCTASTDDVVVTFNSVSAGGSISGGSTICFGLNSGLLILSGQTGSVVKWQSSVSPFSSWTDIANTNTTYTSEALTQTTRFRAVVTSGACPVTYSTPTEVNVDDQTAPVITQCLPDGTVSCVNDVPAGKTSYQDFYNAGGRVTENCTALNKLKVTFVDVISHDGVCKVTRTYIIKDESLNQTTCTQVFTIDDTKAPVINSVVDIQSAPNDNSCGANLYIAAPTSITENCSLVNDGAYYQYTVGGIPHSGYGSFTALFPEGITAISWTVTDICGHASAPIIQTVQVGINLTSISYDNGSTETGNGSGILPMQTSTHVYFVDNKKTEDGYSYAWGLYVDNNGAPGAEVEASYYSLSPVNGNRAEVQVTFKNQNPIPVGNYILSVIKTKDGTACKNQTTRSLTVLKNTFDTELKPFGNQCQAGETGTPSTIIWEVTFSGGGVAPYSLHYKVNLIDESNNQTTACTGTISNITLTGMTPDLDHQSGCNTNNMPYMRVEKTATNSYKVLLKYTMSSITARNFKASIQIDATDQFSVCEIDNGNNSETLQLHGVPDTSEITTD